MPVLRKPARRTLLLALLTSCATYRALPSGAPPAGFSPLALRYEQTKFHLFHSDRDDVQVEAAFASGRAIVALVSRPDGGAFTSIDGGLTWTFAHLEGRFRDVMFDGPLIVGREESRLHCSDDGGQSWRAWRPDAPIDTAAAAHGAIHAVAGGHLYVSADCARTWKTLSPQIAGTWRARSIVVVGASIYVSVRATRDLAPVSTVLDGSSDAAAAALSFVDGHELREPDGIWVTHDGGTLWQKTPLPLDAWLAAVDGQIWAVAADPMIEAASLVRRSPFLAAAVDQQLHGARPDTNGLRAALQFPGRDRLLHGIVTPVFRSVDEGITWQRVDEAPAALRAAIDRQRAAQPSFERAREEQHRAPTRHGGGPGHGGGSGGGYGRHGARGGSSNQRAPQPRAAHLLSPDTFFALLDPARLLARFNSGRALTGVAGDGVLFAYAPTAQFWNALVDAMAAESDAEGEISLGPGRAGPGSAPEGAFALVLSRDGGATWEDLPSPRFDPALREKRVLPFPIGIAAASPEALVLFGATDRNGQVWRETWRWNEEAAR